MTREEAQDIIRTALEKEKKIDELLVTSVEWRQIEDYLEDCFEMYEIAKRGTL